MRKIQCVMTLAAMAFTLSACGALFDKDNTPTPAPLVAFTPEITPHKLWSTQVGSGAHGEYLKLPIALSEDRLFSASQNGYVTATDRLTGKTIWRRYVDLSITSGVSVGDHQVFIGGRDGSVAALEKTDGKLLWKAYASSEILAPVTAGHGVVIAKSIDDRLTAFSAAEGHPLWHYQKTVPGMILHGSSAPQLTHDSVIAGFEDGTLSRLSLRQGHLAWQQVIAIPEGSFLIQRMVDIDADPIIVGDKVYVATYQGQVAALELANGNILWTHAISSYSGMAADASQVYVSDAQGRLWAFNAHNGEVNWQQTGLTARNITGPALIGPYLVVGDAEGYLHWINKQNGKFVARVSVNRSGILATPIADHGVLYIYTKDGLLQAYQTVS